MMSGMTDLFGSTVFWLLLTVGFLAVGAGITWVLIVLSTNHGGTGQRRA